MSLLVDNLFPISISNQNAIDTTLALYPSYYLVVIFLGPISEELLFRGIFFNLFLFKDNVFYKVIVTLVSSFFAYMHTLTVELSMIPYLFSGMLFSCIYLYTKDIKYAIMLYITNDFLSILP